jgi:hypothetical protein
MLGKYHLLMAAVPTRKCIKTSAQRQRACKEYLTKLCKISWTNNMLIQLLLQTWVYLQLQSIHGPQRALRSGVRLDARLPASCAPDISICMHHHNQPSPAILHPLHPPALTNI